jgi:hypothetical protein
MIDNSMIYSQQASAPDEDFGFGSGAHPEHYDPFASSPMQKHVSANSALSEPKEEEEKYPGPGEQQQSPEVPAYGREEDEEEQPTIQEEEEEPRTTEPVLRHREDRFTSIDLDTEGKEFGEDDYLQLKKDVDNLALLAKSLQARGRDFVSKARELAEVSFEVAKEFKNFYEENRSEYRDLARVREQATGQLRYDLARHIQEFEEENLDKPLNAWLEEYTRIVWKCEQRNAANKRLQHYVDKVEKLHASENKLRAKGKPIPAATADRTKRNEHKLGVSRNEFETLHKGLCLELESIWKQRLSIIDPAFRALAEIELLFFDKSNGNHFVVSDALRKIDQAQEEEGQNLQNPTESLRFEYTPDEAPAPKQKMPWWKSFRKASASQ